MKKRNYTKEDVTKLQGSKANAEESAPLELIDFSDQEDCESCKL